MDSSNDNLGPTADDVISQSHHLHKPYVNCVDPDDHLKPESIDKVAIFGFADAQENETLFHEVVAVGEILAKHCFIVVEGGGPGVMKAASVGAKNYGGKVVGVTFYPKEAQNFEGKDPENDLDEEIVTTTYVERTIRLLEQGQVYIVFNGGTGTISEFAMAWGLARLYFGHHKPLILYGEFWHEIIETFRKNMRIRPEELKVFKVVNSPHEVLMAINEFAKEIERGEHEHVKAEAGSIVGESAFTL